jgi:hypothetical protein
MRFLSDLPWLVVGIVVAAFFIELFVSLRAVNKAPDWQELDDNESGATDADRAAAGVRTE